ncbi:MAG: thioredoxin [Lachnospiraceae bacterium]|nr:thioredoxin [Lachnospiraceae bacterium]
MHLSNKKRAILQAAFLLASALMIAYGASRGEVETVWNKAVNICLECIGLG